MVKPVLTLLVATLLSACSSQGGRYAQENYVVDLETAQLCIEATRNCYALALIGPALGDRDIARAYGMPAGHYSWNARQLVGVILNPPGQQYQAEPLDNNRYRIPPRYETHLVWDILAQEYYGLYGEENGVSGLEALRPPLRRF